MTVYHYFSYTPALIPENEQEVFYRHPTFPVEVNQLGVLFPDDGYSINTWKGDEKIRVHCLATNSALVNTSKSRIILECYLGQKLSPTRSAYIFLDGNELNFCYTNLYMRDRLSEDQLEQAIQNKLLFRENSIRYLKNLEKKITTKGLDLEKYLGFLGLPGWLCKKALIKFKSKGSMKISSKLPNPGNMEKMMRVVRLKNIGYTQSQIVREMGFENKSSVTYWLIKYEAIRAADI